MPADRITHSSRIRLTAGVAALSLVLAACIAPAAGDEPTTTTTEAPTTTTTILAAGTLTDLEDPLAPGLGNGGYDVQHYHIDLAWGYADAPSGEDDEAEGSDTAPSLEDLRVRATTTIEAVTTRPVDQVSFDFTGATVSAVTVDGEPAEWEREPTELIVTLPEALDGGTAFATRVEYSGAPGSDPSRLGRHEIGWLGSEGGTWHVRSDPDGSHRWFPSNDHPSDKATFRFDIQVPIDLAAAASGDLTRSYSGIETSNYRWELNKAAPTYMVTAVIGELEVVEDENLSVASGVTIRHLLPPDMVSRPPTALAAVDDMLAFMEERFGRYPHESFGVAVVDGPVTTLGNSTWAVLSRDQLLDADAERVIINHLARNWFGDSVAPATWADVWFTTSIPRYVEWLWVERDVGKRAADLTASVARNKVADSAWPPPDEPRLGDIYVGSMFLQGAATLHAIRLRMGDQAFFDMMAGFYADNAGDWASADDFRETVKKAGGVEILYLFEQWFHADELPGFPDR